MHTHESERIPAWLRRPVTERVGRGPARRAVANLNTVCEEARCPNRGRCMGEDRTAAFLLMGPGCSRDCRFCSVSPGPKPLDAREPEKVARAAAALELEYVVVTSTTRDDLADGGAEHIRAAVEAIRAALPSADVEVLAPDFAGARRPVDLVSSAPIAVFGHNVETVPRLYPGVRPGAEYKRSLEVLAWAAESGVLTKSALLVGLGEEEDEVYAVLRDLRSAGVSIVAIGQYFRPTRNQLAVTRFWDPRGFKELEAAARAMGFSAAACAPYVRSSYRAGNIYRRVKNGRGESGSS
ncbi:MAG TPA: lipoyl synthase [bacterium]|nr:lipoyl synthase [bacterium]